MGRYVDIDKALKELHLNHKDVIYIDKRDTAKRIEKIQGIDLADYVPKEFHDKTCEAMAKAHQEEIADMVRVVRCKECKKCYKDTDALTKQTVLICQKHKNEFDWEKVEADDFCSYGERSRR